MYSLSRSSTFSYIPAFLLKCNNLLSPPSVNPLTYALAYLLPIWPGFVQSLEFLKKSWNLSSNFSDLEKVWKIEVKSGKMVKSLDFFFQSYNKYKWKSLDFGSKNYPATCLPELICYSNHFSPNTYLSSFPLTSRAAYPPIHQCRKPSYPSPYLPTYLPSLQSSYLPANLPAYLAAYLPTYIHTYLPPYQPTYIRANLPTYLTN